jgi:hypothetical protein
MINLRKWFLFGWVDNRAARKTLLEATPFRKR